MAREKILYVSDLDGTLLNDDSVLSEFTVNTINSLVEQGMIFSYASARSYVTASRVTAELPKDIPVIVYNGSYIMENGTGRKIISNEFSKDGARRVIDTLLERGIYPTVYSYVNGEEKFLYLPEKESEDQRRFNAKRAGDVRDCPVKSAEELYAGNAFYIICIGKDEELAGIEDILKDEFEVTYFFDLGVDAMWLDVLPKGVSKANGVLELKRFLGCDKVVCFGNAKNDLSMFRAADECYAVANAADELKAESTAVIDANSADGVAKWLLENYKK